MPLIVLIFVFESFFAPFGLFVHWNYQLSVTFLRISLTSGFLSSFVFIWNRSFHFLKLFGVLFLCFYHHFPLGEYDNFCVLLTFGVTFWYLEIFFSWNGWIKMPKNMEKLADLVCTKEIFLCKSGQVSNKCAIRLLVFYLLLLVIPGKWGQMPPSVSKWDGRLLMHYKMHLVN